MRFGLASRIALLTAAAVALTALGVSAFGFVQTGREVNRDIDRFLEERTEEIIDGLRDRPRARNADQIRTRGAATDNDAEVQTIDESGNILASTGAQLPIDEEDISLAQQNGQQLIRTVEIDGLSFRLATTSVEGGALQVARSLDSTNNLLANLRKQVLLIGLAVAAIAGLVGGIIAKRAMHPLATLTKSVETVAVTQDLSTRVGNDSTDEVGRLSRGFDDMLTALSKSREQQHRLVQDAAHELRTPLTSVNANIDLLARAKDLDPDTREEIIDGVRSELRQLNTLFTEIVELATDERDRTSHREVNLVGVAESAAARQRARTSNPIEIVGADNPGAESLVIGDPSGLERAIGNLISNAVKYSPDNAAVRVEIDGHMVSVSDEGPGIPEAERKKIFERFYRSDTARAEPGSGLGLAIVEKIVTDHGGRTFVHASPTGGARVGFELPNGSSSE